MKQKDILLIVVAVIVSSFLSFFISKALIVSPKNRHQQVKVVDAITADFPSLDNKEFKKYFNQDSNNPTKLITIGGNNNPAPFNGQ